MKTVKIEFYQEEINFLLVGLELFTLNLNNIWAIKKDSEEQEKRYHLAFYLYERLLNYSSDFDNYVQIQLNEKNKKISKKVLTFFK